MTGLPEVGDDYAKLWWTEHNDGDIEPRLIEYNAYLQALEDIETGKLQVNGIDGPVFVSDLKRFIRKDFRKHGMEAFNGNDHYHKALWAAVAKNYIDGLREGTFTGPGGFENRKPEVADAIQDHIDELIESSLLRA